MTRQSKGFTLVEVCLAIGVMATGVLSMCALYTLGYRENRQSVEDVASAAYADAYLSSLVQGLSATNMKWSAWCQIGTSAGGEMRAKDVADGRLPQNGWLDYVEKLGDSSDYRVKGNPRMTADGAANAVLGKLQTPYKGSLASLPGDWQYGLVVTRRGAVIQLAFRAARRKETLMTQPVFVSEVHFQGNPEE